MNVCNNKIPLGSVMHGWMKDLFPICRSLTGPGVRQTLHYIQELLSRMVIHEVPSGTQVFDWTVPDEWSIRDAYIADEFGERIVDFKENNLHVVGYSIPIDRWMELDELDGHLYSLPDQPDAIPYVTSYYKRRWGFCLTHERRQTLLPGRYHAVIDADLKPGVLNYGELILPGNCKQEVLLSTYICHPSMANNELSGPVVTIAISQWLESLVNRKYTYRIIFIPETIGSIVYLSRNLNQLKRHVIAGFNITCIGDDRSYSYLPSRKGETLSDKVAVHVLKHIEPNFHRYSWLDRGSDERQYCAPGVDLPVASIMRSKYGEYPEYHTSLDKLDFVTSDGLEGGYQALYRALELIENNIKLKITVTCEPNLGKRGLYSTLSIKGHVSPAKRILDILSYCDGELSVLEIAELLSVPFWELMPTVEQLMAYGLLVSHDD
jgi:aminopeptidase-like protein